MEEDDILDAMAAGQRPQGAPGANYDGRIAVNPRTGQRLVYRINPSGHGRFVALSADTAAPAARDRVTELTQRAQTGGRTLNLANQFVDLNTHAATAGLQNDPNLPPWLRPQNAQRFENLSSAMVGANWVPGTSGMMNTATEQQMMRGRYPNPSFGGNTNRDILFQMTEDLAVQRAAVSDMRHWLTQHATLDGWDDQWAAKETQLRERLRPQIRRDWFSAHRGGANRNNSASDPLGIR